MSVNCKTNVNIQTEAIQGRKKQPWTPAELSTIRKRIDLESDRLEASAQQYSVKGQAAAAKRVADQERAIRKELALMGDAVNIGEGNYNRLEAMLARQFGAMRGGLGFGSAYSKAGSVRKFLLDTSRVAENVITTTARLASIPRIRNLKMSLKKHLPTMSRDMRHEWVVRFIEEGGIPRSRAAYGNDAAANALLDRRYNKFLDDVEGLGLDPGAFDELSELSFRVASTFDEVREIAVRWGVDVGEMTNIGFFARTLKEDARFRLDIAQAGDPEPFMPGINASSKNPSYKDSRNAWIYTPRDMQAFVRLTAGDGAEAQFREFLRKTSGLSADELDNLPAKLSAELGRPVDTTDVYGAIADMGKVQLSDILSKQDELLPFSPAAIEELMNDTPKWIEFLHDNFTGEQLDSLFDSGVLSRVPMTTREVFDYLVKQYKLPFKDVSEMFLTDPQAAIEAYGRKLRKLTGQSAVLKRVVSDGYEEGWVIPDQVFLSDTDKYKDFVSLKGLNLEELGLEPSFIEQLGDGRVHPLVFNQLEGVLNISRSPKAMGEIANVVAWMNRNMNVGALLSGLTGYVSRITYGNILNFVAGSGNLLRLIPAHIDIMRSMREGVEFLDNTKPFIRDGDKVLTKREAFEQFLALRYTEIVPLGEYESTAALGAIAKINPLNLPRAVMESIQYGNAYGGGFEGFKKTVGMLGKKAEDFQSSLFLPMATYGNISDLAFRWALAQSVADKVGVPGSINKALSYVTNSPRVSSFKEAIEHTDRHFIDYKNVGDAVSFYGRYIRPFGIYAAKNPAMIANYALRHPARLMAYLRLSKLVSDENAHPDVTEAGFAEFELDSLPVTTHYDPEKGYATVLYPNNYDPFLDAFTFYKEGTEAVSRMLGANVGSGYERREALLGKGGTMRNFLAEQFGNNINPTIGTLVQALSGRDGLGREIDKADTSFAGFPISGELSWLISKYAPLAKFNRLFGGSPVVKDARGNVIQEARPAITGLTPQGEARGSQAQRAITDQQMGGWSTLLREVMGFNIKVIDLEKGNQKTFDDIRRTRTELRKLMTKMEEKYADPVVSDAERSKLAQELQTMAYQDANLQVDLYRVGEYLKRRGVPSSTELAKLKDLKQNAQGIRLPANVAEEAVKTIQRYQQYGSN